MFQPFFQFGGGLFEDSRCEGVIKIPVAPARENVEVNDFQFIRSVPSDTRSVPARFFPNDEAISVPYSLHAGSSTIIVPFLFSGR